MNQKNLLNNNQNTSKNSKKRFFILIISGIIATFLLIAIIFLVKKSNSKTSQLTNEKETNSETNNRPNIEWGISKQGTRQPDGICFDCGTKGKVEKITYFECFVCKKREKTDDNWRCKECNEKKFKCLLGECQKNSQEKSNCPYLNEQNLTTLSDTDSQLCKMLLPEKELSQWREIPKDYIIKLWKKGYHWDDILRLWGWKIPEPDIPDLKAEKEIGVINTLSYLSGIPCSVIERLKTMPAEEKEAWLKKMKNEEIGLSSKAIFIVRKSSTPALNLDKKIQSGAGPYGDTLKYVKKLVDFTLQQENINPQQYEITLLNCIGSENFGREGDIKYGVSMGKSIGTAYYLGLLSSVHQKPINQTIATTGFICLKEKKAKLNDREIYLPAGTVLPIAGIKAKCIAATDKGINRLVLSKYQTSPNLLSLPYKEKKYDEAKLHVEERWSSLDLECDYQGAVSPAIKAQITTHFCENAQELRELILGGKLS